MGRLIDEAVHFGLFKLRQGDCVLMRRREDAEGWTEIPLRRKVFDLLKYMAENPGRLLAAEELLSRVWPNVHVQADGLKGYVLYIRIVLGDDPHAPTYIETVRGRGYRFIAPIAVPRESPEIGVGGQGYHGSIMAIGVWDTVGAMGIPDIDQTDMVRLDLLRFADTALGLKTAAGFHAIAADEQRVDFSPTLWDDRTGVVQQFFPGAHSDVGGSYPMDAHESDLSDISLAWMQAQFRTVGVRFKLDIDFPANGMLGPMHAPWLAKDFFTRPTAPRLFPAKDSCQISCHPTLGARLGQKVTTINPNNAALDVTGPYVPLALIHAGYVSAAGLGLA